MRVFEQLTSFLDEHRVPYTVLSHPPAYSADQVARAEHLPPHDLAKVVVKTGQRVLMVVLPGTRKLDLHKVPERGARLATEQELATLFPGCEVGAMPPFGNLFRLPVLVDRGLARDEEIVFQAGTHTRAIRMRCADFVRLVQPVIDDYALVEREA